MDNRRLLVRETPGRFTLNRLDKLCKPAIRHFELVHIITVEEDAMDRLFVVIALIAPHGEFTGGNQHHGSTVFLGYLSRKLEGASWF